MSALMFHTKPSIENSGEDLSDDAFVWVSKCIGGRDVVEEFVSCGVWPLATGASFKHVKVDLTPISKPKVPLPRFPGEDDVGFPARVEQEARVIVGNYTCTEHEACIVGFQINGRSNRVLELARVAYGPLPTPVSAEVLKKRKADATGNVLAKRPKVPEKKRIKPTKVTMAHVKGGLKWSSYTDISSANSAKLSKSVVPHAIASAAAARGSKNVSSASGSKAGVGGPGSKTMPEVKMAAPSAKKYIIPSIGDLAAISSEGTHESSLHGQTPEVQSRAEPWGHSLEPRV
jgi:hypothetical protein